MRRLWIAWFGLLAACGEDAAPKPPATLLGRINAYRGEKDLAPVEVEQALEAAATAHAEEMARLGYFGHFSPVPGNRTPRDRLTTAGWPDDRDFYEICATAADAAAAFRKMTAGHSEKLADATYRAVGIGRSGDIWVLILG